MGANRSGGDGSARVVLEAWREQQADRLDPIRFRFIEALASRASRHGGEARRILDDRLYTLLEAYADELEARRSKAADPDSAKPARAPAHGTLAELLKHIGDRKAAATMGDAVAADVENVGEDCPRQSVSAELPALLEFRKIWSKVRTDGQLRQSLEQVPTNAGPLNSGVLVHRSIMLMRELSPEYLQHFMAYADTLSWMEQMQGDGVLATAMPGAAGSSKQVRSKPRKRRA